MGDVGTLSLIAQQIPHPHDLLNRPSEIRCDKLNALRSDSVNLTRQAVLRNFTGQAKARRTQRVIFFPDRNQSSLSFASAGGRSEKLTCPAPLGGIYASLRQAGYLFKLFTMRFMPSFINGTFQFSRNPSLRLVSLR